MYQRTKLDEVDLVGFKSVRSARLRIYPNDNAIIPRIMMQAERIRSFEWPSAKKWVPKTVPNKMLISRAGAI